MFNILVKKKVLKKVEKLPLLIQEKLSALVDDLREKGPVQSGWPNYSRIGKEKYHCHLSPKWVACWYYKKDKSLIIEVYYAGSREKAPY